LTLQAEFIHPTFGSGLLPYLTYEVKVEIVECCNKI